MNKNFMSAVALTALTVFGAAPIQAVADQSLTEEQMDHITAGTAGWTAPVLHVLLMTPLRQRALVEMQARGLTMQEVLRARPTAQDVQFAISQVISGRYLPTIAARM